MAKIKLGKLKMQLNKEGFAFKMGDGDVKRVYFSRQDKDEEVYDEDEYIDEEEYAQDDYEGEYDEEDSYYDEEEEDSYSAPRRVYYDEDGREVIDTEDDGDYDEYEEEREEKTGIRRSDIILYALLVILPPLGIYALWKKRGIEPMKRMILSAASAIWFIVLLVLIINGISGKGRNDSTFTGIVQQPETTAIPVEAPLDDEDDGLTLSLEDDDGLTEDTTDDGLTEDTTEDDTEETETTGDASTTYVYSTNTGMYYHKTADCPDKDGDLTQVDLTIARSTRNQQPCPTCYGSSTNGTTYYMQEGGKYYHTDATCSGMTNAQPTTKAAAVKDGRTVCPTCIGVYWARKGGTYYHKTSNCSGMKNASNITKEKAEEQGFKACPVCLGSSSSSSSSSSSGGYYSTKTGKYYHANKNCSGMKNATKITAAVAKQRNQTACPVCIGTKSSSSSSSSSSKSYYATKNGTYYHTKSTCSGMKNATKITLATAKKYGKKACPKCVGSTSTSSSSTKSTSSSSSSSKTTTSSSGTYYYATEDGTYYHKTSTCSGMKNAKKITLTTAKKYGKTACPTCLGGSSNNVVYANKGGKYYHKASSCSASGMTGASAVTLSKAKSAGKTACPYCYGSKTSTKSTTSTTKTYYATAGGTYYHTKSTCSGMKNAKKVSLATAKKYGKTACPVCAGGVVAAQQSTSTSAVYCYATKNGQYYHKNSTCSGMSGASRITLTVAKKNGKTACPICVTGTATSSSSADKDTTCYIFSGNEYFHASSSCSGLTDGEKTTVSAAKKKGLSVCPSCAGNKLTTYVWVEALGLKYHASQTCSGMTNAKKVSLATAIEKAYKRCTTCGAPSVS